MSNTPLPVVVIGAGPVGLAAAAHLLARGETPLVLEASDQIAGSVRQWAHVRMFSPWRYTVDSASVALLAAHGWQHPPADELPTGGDLIEQYLQPFADLPTVRPHLHLNSRVVAISRQQVDKMKDATRETAPFILHIQRSDGSEWRVEAKAVIDASGTWTQPNPMGANGLPAIGEAAAQAHIAYGIPDVLGTEWGRYANRRVMVVGSGHSAINALLDLSRLAEREPQTELVWVMRSARLERVYGGGADDQLPARGQLGQRIQQQVAAGTIQIKAPFHIEAVQLTPTGVQVSGGSMTTSETLEVDEIIVATGARPDLAMLRELRLSLDPALESVGALGSLIDPNIHSCGTVRPHGERELRQPEPNFYIVGMKSYGRAPTFLLATGYEQVRSVVAALVGDWEAAAQVELVLPETGACSSDGAGGGGACCGTPAATTDFEPIALETINLINTNTRTPNATFAALTMGATATLTATETVTTTRACGCSDDCCGDGQRSTSCGCGSDCCA